MVSRFVLTINSVLVAGISFKQVAVGLSDSVQTRWLKPRHGIWLFLYLAVLLFGQEASVPHWLQLQSRIPLPSILAEEGLAPTDIQPGPDQSFILLDRTAKQLIRLERNGTVVFSGGFGQAEESLFDPVDFRIDRMVVYVLDRGRDGWVRFDYRLHFLDFQPLDRDLDPSRFTVDSFGNLLVVSTADQGVFRKSRIGWDPNPLIDFQYLSSSPGLILELETNSKGDVALLSQDPDRLYIFSSTGRLLAQWPLNAAANIRGLLYFQKAWTIAAEEQSQLVFRINDQIVAVLPLDRVQDVFQFNNQVIVLTSKDIWIYRLSS